MGPLIRQASLGSFVPLTAESLLKWVLVMLIGVKLTALPVLVTVKGMLTV